jgi:hypothetical protein
MRGFHDRQRELVMSQLKGVARGDTPEGRAERLVDAEQRWQNIRMTPYILGFVIFLLSGGLGLICLGSVGFSFGAALVGGVTVAVILVRREHRAAFVAREMANGSNEAAAHALYNRRYED